MKQKNQEAMFSAKKQALNIGIVVLILAFTLGFLFTNLYDPENPIRFSDFIHMKWGWLLFGVVCLFLSVLCEARSLSIILRKIGHLRSLRECTVYASSDIYFSAITPSATGGQPAAAYYMTKSGIPLSQSSAVLVLNVSIYTLGLLVVSGLAFLVRPEFYMEFPQSAKLCVWLGIGFHALLIVACMLFMFSRRIVLLVGRAVINLLCLLHIFKNKRERLDTFRASIETYRSCMSIVRKNPSLIFRLLFLSVMQRLLLTPITYLVFLTMGIDAGFVDVVIMQTFCTVGASAIPLPGGTGISEGLFIQIFTRLIADPNDRFRAMILSRTVSGYLAILLCGWITMSYHMKRIIRPSRLAALHAHDAAAPAEEDAPDPVGTESGR